MSTGLIREICDIADKHCDGYVRWTTRNNIEFMVDEQGQGRTADQGSGKPQV